MLKSTLRKACIAGPVIVIHFCMLLWPAAALPQSPVLQFTANYVTASSTVGSYSAFPATVGTFSSCSSTSYTYTWSNGTSNQLKLTSFTANSKTYIVSGITSVVIKLRRVNNANVTGIRNILYSETTAASATSCVTPTTLAFKAPYNDDMASFLNNNILNHGTDNLFTNAGNADNNNNNIERVDVVFTTGISSAYPADAGFVLCERGAVNAHDGFRIAAILSKNGSNDPASFGAVKICTAGNGSNNGSWGHPTIANGNKQLAAYVLRKDSADTYLRVSSNVNQEIGGVFFSLADLGVTANQTVYGYCLIGPDGTANPTSAQLLTTSNAAIYPTGTTEAQGGGLDLISINTFFGTNLALASSFVTSFKGTVQSTNTLLNWNLNSLTEGTLVTLERSADAVSFSPVYSYRYDGNTNNSFRDKPGTGSFYYRLQIKTAESPAVFSQLVLLTINQNKQGWRVYPTLAKPGDPVTIDNISEGLYTARLYNINSAIIYQTSFNARNGKGIIILPQKQLPPGIYYLILVKDGARLPGSGKIVVRRE